MCNNRGIGVDGGLPWRLKGDMAFFRKITSKTADETRQNAVVMGRKTWESIPVKFRPLKNRINVVISSTLQEGQADGATIARSFEDAIRILQEEYNEQLADIFVIGGASIYEAALESPLCFRIYLTRVQGDFKCDTFFPEFENDSKFKEVENLDEKIPQGIQEDSGIKYTFHVFEKV